MNLQQWFDKVDSEGGFEAAADYGLEDPSVFPEGFSEDDIKMFKYSWKLFSAYLQNLQNIRDEYYSEVEDSI